MRTSFKILCCALVMLAAGASGALAADKPDPNIDPVLPDPAPNNAYFPPATATAGAADPGPVLNAMPVSGAMLAGRGPGCTNLSPCAVNSPPLERVSQPIR